MTYHYYCYFSLLLISRSLKFLAYVLNNNRSHFSLWGEQQWLCLSVVFVWSICLFQRGDCMANREMCCDSINFLSPLSCSLTSKPSGYSPLNTMVFLKFNRNTPFQKFHIGHVFFMRKEEKTLYNSPYNSALVPRTIGGITIPGSGKVRHSTKGCLQ